MTDEYVLGLIAQAELEWYENPGGGFVANMNDFMLYFRSQCLTISKGVKRITICQPKRSKWKEQTPVEVLLKEISTQAAKQCLERYSEAYQQQLREELLRELTGVLQRREE